jgi:hypothetical protein
MGRKRTREATNDAPPVIAEDPQQRTRMLVPSPNSGTARYPLLESLLAQRGLPLRGTYTLRDGAQILECSTRTLQDWIANGRLLARHLPGRHRFLSEDLETFLRGSLCGAKDETEE